MYALAPSLAAPFGPLFATSALAARGRVGSDRTRVSEASGAAATRVSPARLYEEHRDRVFHLCLRYSAGNVAWAEDVTQDVFVRLLERLPALSEHDDLGGWVYRVASNTCLTRLKRERSVWSRVRRVVSSGRATRDVDTPERKAQVRQGLQAALAALQEMPANERVVFSMRYLDDVSQQEIAQALELSKGYVSKLLARARERLKKQGWEVPDDS